MLLRQFIEPRVSLTYYYQSTGGGNAQEIGDDLIIEYLFLNIFSVPDGPPLIFPSWKELAHHPGNGPDMTIYQQNTVILPYDALRSDFQLRIRTSCSSVNDDWFVDDVKIEATGAWNTQPMMLDASDETINGWADEMKSPVKTGDDRNCFPSSDSAYSYWEDLDKPDCWRSRYQCYGDIDGQTEGEQKYRVGPNDLDILTENWGRATGDPKFNPCADIDHDGRVGAHDLEILITNWKKTDAELSSDCQRGG